MNSENVASKRKNEYRQSTVAKFLQHLFSNCKAASCEADAPSPRSEGGQMRSQSAGLDYRRLQVGQQRHDQLAHQDILGLEVPRRLTHFTLHFAKYVGGLIRAMRVNDAELKKRVITDSLVIALAAANSMRLDLRNEFETSEPMGEPSSGTPLSASQFESLIFQYAEIVGEMSKACEALDHLERFPSRDVLERGVIFLLPVIESLAELEGIDLARAISDRWRMVERKNLQSFESKTIPPIPVAA